MALNLTNLFTALGRIGRTAYLIESGQTGQGVPFTELAGYAYINPEWIGALALSYDSLIRAETAPMNAWQQAAQTILQSLVAADDPFYGSSIPQSLAYLYNQMIAQGKTVQSCTIGKSVSADSGNVGTGAVFVTLQRGDGLIQQNTIAEASTLLITDDSYTGSATAGQEPWTWNGAPNVSSLGTNTPVNLWDFDYPQGSAASASGRCISAAQDASSAGNYLTNGDFDSTAVVSSQTVPNNWHLITGAWGTDIQIVSGGLDGGKCVQFNPGATLNNLTQQFGSASVTDPTNAAAGTLALPAPFRSYVASIWLKAGGVISGGVLTVDLVDGSGTVINDQQGVANSATVALTGYSTSWTNQTFSFRLPAVSPVVIRLRVRITTALAGATLLMDDACLAAPTNLYPGGPSLAVFSNPAVPFEAIPDPDGWTVTFTNNRGGASLLASWQPLLNRLYQSPTFLAPYSGSPNILDNLITGV
jgi:hypothetical protein